MNKDSRILIISNNALSQTANNGKTIESLFEKANNESIAQLYFREEIPDSKICTNFFKVTERDILCKKSKNVENKDSSISSNTIKNTNSKLTNIQKNSFLQFVREIIWKTNFWKSKKMIEWLDTFHPNIIFFVAGDSFFAYDIMHFIKKRYNSKLILYFTDDYVLRKEYDSFLERKMVHHLKNKVKKTIEEANIFITISDKMKKDYFNIFGKDSIICRNKVQPMKFIENFEDYTSLKLIYAGSLYYGRDTVLLSIAETLDKINIEKNQKHELLIFTGSNLSNDQFEQFNKFKSLRLGGFLNKEQLYEKLTESNILIFVESFDKKYIDKTKYSFSTKIPEYLSLNRCILAIGPKTIGSMEYLSESAYCINSLTDINEKIKHLIQNKGIRDEVMKKCANQFIQYLEEEKQNDLYEKFNDLF